MLSVALDTAALYAYAPHLNVSKKSRSHQPPAGRLVLAGSGSALGISQQQLGKSFGLRSARANSVAHHSCAGHDRPASLIYYSPPRSNGLIGGSSFMIEQSLASVSGSRLLCPAVVIK